MGNQHKPPPDFRVIPSIEQVRQRPALTALRERFGEVAAIDALRESADALRARIAAGDDAPDSIESAAVWLEGDARTRLEQRLQPSLVRVINATGVIVHTNLGRAPLPAAALARVAEVAGGYLNLEYDLGAGRRGARDVHAEALLCRLTGAEAAVVVNNCAAATMIALASLARGRDVVISRGELVEIGGGFRVPDVMTASGARLREVGTTNRTRAGDYALAIGDRTGALLRVHPSNFRIDGFTERATLDELVALARRFNLPLIEDLGSGCVTVVPSGVDALDREASVQASVRAGVDVVCFSGDKLLGGPQAGIIVGRAERLRLIRKHPLMRALRVDKLTYAALEATLIEHLTGRALDTVPALRMASMPVEAIAVRAEILAGRLRDAGFAVDVVDGYSTIGGGSAPGSQLATRLAAVRHPSMSADELGDRLRRGATPVVARIEDDRVMLDLRTVEPRADEQLGEVIASMIG